MPLLPDNRKVHKLAKTLRSHPTDPECKLWTYLRAHRLCDVHFRRQHAIGKYVVDFCAPRQKLIIELDGSQHLDRIALDANRTAYLQQKGYHVLRFWNSDVMNNIESVLETIQQALNELNSTR